MTLSLRVRTALVTGGAGGIGLACVTALADCDADATAEAAATGHVADLWTTPHSIGGRVVNS